MSARAVAEFCRACGNTRVVVVGKSKLHLRAPENCIDVSNQTSLLQLVWLVRAARLTVSVDSGPSHIAAAVSPQLISVHTRTDPRRVGPHNPEAWIWRDGEVRQMRDFAPDEKLRPGRPFRTTDVPTLTNLVSDLWTRAV